MLAVLSGFHSRDRTRYDRHLFPLNPNDADVNSRGGEAPSNYPQTDPLDRITADVFRPEEARPLQAEGKQRR